MSNTYEEIVNSFEKIDAAKAEELVQGGTEVVIYIGKEVCPFCQLFVPKLKKAAEETTTHIYFVDSDDRADMKEIMAFRKKYGIPTVPGLIYSNGDTVNVKCESSMTEEEIKTFKNK